MAKGVIAELSELIALKSHAQAISYRTEGKAIRAGVHLSKLRGRGMDFSEVRNYQSGDEIRHMEWRVTARTGRPHIKLYQEERERPVIIFADFSASMYFGTKVAFKSVVAARLAAILAWTVERQGDRLGALLCAPFMHQEFMPRSRKAGVLPFLASLSHYTKQFPKKNESTPAQLGEGLKRLRRVVKPGSIVVILSDFYELNSQAIQQLTRLKSHNDLLVYRLCDPLELEPPPPKQYAVTNGQQILLVDTRVPQIARQYAHYCQERSAALQTAFQSLQIQAVQVTPTTDLPLLVRETFPRRKHA